MMLISTAMAGEEKTVQKRGLLDLGYGGLELGGGLDGAEWGKVAVAIREKPVAIPVPVPKPYPVTVDRPVPVKVRKSCEKLHSFSSSFPVQTVPRQLAKLGGCTLC